MTLPRELSLLEKEGTYRLRSLPVKEAELLRESSNSLGTRETGAGMELITPVPTGELLLELDLKIEPASGTSWEETGEFGIQLCNRQDSLWVTIHPSTEQVSIDRTKAGPDHFSSDFSGVHTAPLSVDEAGSMRLHAFIDRSSIELFLNNGECVMTELFFPSSPYDAVTLFSKDPAIRLVEGDIHQLKSIWSEPSSSLK